MYRGYISETMYLPPRFNLFKPLALFTADLVKYTYKCFYTNICIQHLHMFLALLKPSSEITVTIKWICIPSCFYLLPMYVLISNIQYC